MAIKQKQWVPLPFTDRFEPVANPFCGLYTIYHFCVWDEHEQGEEGNLIEECVIPEGQKLALTEINLNRYSEEALPPEALMIIERVFRFFRQKRVQMIVRFLYDWNGTNIQTEPKEVSRILQHMDQVAPLMKRFDDAIYIAQGLFIGNWGEMHGSRHTSQASLVRLYNKWRGCTGPHTLLAVRSPAMWRMLLRTYDPPADPDAAAAIGLGLFNDGLLASDTDFGTYGDLHKVEVTKAEDKMLREYEIEFQNRLCRFVPNGGETVQPNPLNNPRQAINEMNAIHVSYLNSKYDTRVLDKWKAEACPLGEAGWKKDSTYNYIVSHLGYRFVLRNVDVKQNSSGNAADVTIRIENTGFSACYRPLTVALQIANTSHKVLRTVPLQADTRMWQPGVTAELKTGVDLRDWQPDEVVELRLYLEEPVSRERIQIANSFLLNRADGTSLLGTFQP